MYTFKFAGLGPLLAVVIAVTSGCGSSVSVYPAKGKVTYTDGSPMPGGARLILEAPPGSGFQVWGDVKSDGTFDLMTADDHGNVQEGAPVGEYRAYLVPVAPEAATDEEEKEPVEVTAGKYGDPEESDLAVKIEAQESNEVTIKVEKPER